MSARDPLEVRCTYCKRPKGKPCARCFDPKCPCASIEFHAARIRAAERGGKEKERE